jgi:Recombinase
MSAMRSAADEAHREQTSERVHEAHVRLAMKGAVTGGRKFGYRNEDVIAGFDYDGRPRRSHVIRKINPDEAAVVVRIFTLYADGYGHKAIAKQLNAEGALAPKPFVRRDPTKVLPVRGWAPATVRGILHPDFPLRRFVSCASCSIPLTGSWSKGRAKRYAYYHCRKCRQVKVSKPILESRFVELLAQLKPDPAYMALFNALFEMSGESGIWRPES